MPTLNLDAAKAARAEVAKPEEAPRVEFGGRVFDLTPELPFGVFMRLAALKDDKTRSLESITNLLRVLFEGDYEAFMDLGPSMPDLLVLMEHLTDVYGVDVGEAEGSPAS